MESPRIPALSIPDLKDGAFRATLVINANILNLPTYTVTAIEENEHDYRIDAEVKSPPRDCPHCHSGAHGGM